MPGTPASSCLLAKWMRWREMRAHFATSSMRSYDIRCRCGRAGDISCSAAPSPETQGPLSSSQPSCGCRIPLLGAPIDQTPNIISMNGVKKRSPQSRVTDHIMPISLDLHLQQCPFLSICICSCVFWALMWGCFRNQPTIESSSTRCVPPFLFIPSFQEPCSLSITSSPLNLPLLRPLSKTAEYLSPFFRPTCNADPTSCKNALSAAVGAG